MNPIYVVLCWKLWYVLKKPIFLWYTHKHVDMKLRVASWFVRTIFTASSESLRLNTKKKMVTGHGIDTTFFSADAAVNRHAHELLTVGRIASAKRIDILLDALALLPDATLTIAGGPVTDADRAYEHRCKTRAAAAGIAARVRWLGPVSQGEARALYQQAGVFVHASETGSLDKVLLEAAACGAPVVSASDVAPSVPGVLHVARTPAAVRDGIVSIASANHASAAGDIARLHGLPSLITRLCDTMSQAV
jgi:glycosyltransferase involved in cell wall biosynthesis